MSAEIIHGDCLEVLRGMPDASVDAVVTSPPYAMQRAAQYGGIHEAEYPAWTVAWMREVARVLTASGSVLINIREHVKDGELSDYVHRMRMALRADAWVECDELIWFKPDGPPVGHPKRPRRSWERILWFSRARQPYCNSTANGRTSRFVGMSASRSDSWVNGSGAHRSGIARQQDVAIVPVAAGERRFGHHPAAYPVPLATWMIRLVTPENGTVLDPFAGSGSTGVACVQLGHRFIGIEREAAYVEIARKRIADAQAQLQLGVA